MLNKTLFFSLWTLGIASIASVDQVVENPWFVGGVLGYGSTTWRGLVPDTSKQNAALNVSTPIEVEEGGMVWGIAGGVEAFKNFHLQLDYMHYPRATIHFDPDSLYSIDNDDSTQFSSETYTWSIQGKFLVPWRETNLKVFASGGAAWIARRDDLLKEDTASPTFGLGANYTFNPHVMAEIAFSYTSGNGKSELNPAEDFIPFLYAVFARVYYRIG